MLKKVFLFFSLLLTFSYGIAVGLYQIFPYSELRTFKNFIEGDVSSDYLKNINTHYYLTKQSIFELIFLDSYDLLFIGDSITGNIDWGDLFPGYTIANRGVGGVTTRGILNRIDTITQIKANKAFIMIGINDITNGIEVNTIANNYISIIEELGKNEDMQLYVESTLYLIGFNKEVDALNARIKNYCIDNNITFIDLNSSLSSQGELKKMYSFEGLHLNGKGYLVWLEKIKNFIK